MSDLIRRLTAELAEHPDSAAALTLAELLRQRGQQAAALRVARTAVERRPGDADAHDALARILADTGDPAEAYAAWRQALALVPAHPGALKGLAFLHHRAGDAARAREYLERAVAADPTDRGALAALARLGGAVPAASPPRPMPEVDGAAPSMPEPFSGEGGYLLADARGRPLAGSVLLPGGEDRSEVVAAHAAALAREADRAMRLLDLGALEALTAECADGAVHLRRPTADTALLGVRDRSVPAARLERLAVRATEAARRWLEVTA